MDRDELQARIRARRSGQPYRRGTAVPQRLEPEEWSGEPEVPQATSSQPEAPQTIFPPVPPGGPSYIQPREEAEDTRQWAPPVPVQPVPAVPQRGYTAPDVVYEDQLRAEPAYAGEQAWTGTDRDIESTDARYELPAHAYARPERRRAPGAPFLVLGLVVLGAIALLGGAALAGMITRRDQTAGPGVATATPAASAVGPVATASPGPLPSASPTTPEGSAEPSATPRFFFADGFTAAAEPCLVQPTQPSCPAPGTVVPPGNSTVWILVTFEQIRGGDLIGVHGVGPDDVPIGDASWQAPGAGGSANGHAYFGYSIPGLPAGEYEISVTRNGEPAAVTSFRIDG